MDKRSLCTLIYIEETHVDGKPKSIEHKKVDVNCSIKDIYSSKYYEALNRGVKLTMLLKIRSFLIDDFEGGELRYIEHSGKRYSIDNINGSSARFVLVFLKEMK